MIRLISGSAQSSELHSDWDEIDFRLRGLIGILCCKTALALLKTLLLGLTQNPKSKPRIRDIRVKRF